MFGVPVLVGLTTLRLHFVQQCNRRLGTHSVSLFEKETASTNLVLNEGYADLLISSARPYLHNKLGCLAIVCDFQDVSLLQSLLVQAGKLHLHHDIYFGHMERREDERSTSAYFQVGILHRNVEQQAKFAHLITRLLYCYFLNGRPRSWWLLDLLTINSAKLSRTASPNQTINFSIIFWALVESFLQLTIALTMHRMLCTNPMLSLPNGGSPKSSVTL